MGLLLGPSNGEPTRDEDLLDAWLPMKEVYAKYKIDSIRKKISIYACMHWFHQIICLSRYLVLKNAFLIVLK